jgi:hypothetical protein
MGTATSCAGDSLRCAPAAHHFCVERQLSKLPTGSYWSKVIQKTGQFSSQFLSKNSDLTMLCSNCGTDNTLGRSHCVICTTSLPVEQQPSPTKNKLNSAERVGFGIGVGLSMVVFQMVSPFFFDRPSGGGINWLQVMCAGIAGAVGAVLGKKLALFFSKPKS